MKLYLCGNRAEHFETPMKLYLVEAKSPKDLIQPVEAKSPKDLIQPVEGIMKLYLANAHPDYFATAPPTSMKLYNVLSTTDPTKALLPCKRLARGVPVRFLVSYFFHEHQDIVPWIHDKLAPLGIVPEVVCDSGAFSAFTLGGKRLKLADYAAWIRRQVPAPDFYANLDVLGDPERTWRNQKVLEADGLHPLPVVHVGEDDKHIERVAEQYDYIAAGGMVPHLQGNGASTELRQFLETLFNTMAKHHSNARVHGFGLAEPTLLRAYPFYSADNSAWLSRARFGKIRLYDEANMCFQVADINDKAQCMRLSPMLRSYGVSMGDLVRLHRGRTKSSSASREWRTVATAIGMLAHQHMAEHITHLHASSEPQASLQPALCPPAPAP